VRYLYLRVNIPTVMCSTYLRYRQLQLSGNRIVRVMLKR